MECTSPRMRDRKALTSISEPKTIYIQHIIYSSFQEHEFRNEKGYNMDDEILKMLLKKHFG